MGGQIPNNLALLLHLHRAGVKIAGTSAEMIDSAEDRDKFSKICDREGIPQPQWARLLTQQAAFSTLPTRWATPCSCAPATCSRARP